MDERDLVETYRVHKRQPQLLQWKLEAKLAQRHIDRIMEFDRGAFGGRVVHVDYYELVRDPVAQMRKIHATIGIDTPDEIAHSVGEWHRSNPKNARGRNEYTLEQWGAGALARPGISLHN